MKILFLPVGCASALLFSTLASVAEIKTVVERNDEGTPEFKFKSVPAPSKTDAAAKRKFTIISGEPDAAGGEVTALTDGDLPGEGDAPAENFFFNAGTKGGRLQLDLGGAMNISQVNTYSWHPGTRGPQVYTLYASDGTLEGFNATPKEQTDPVKSGWKLIAKVDTRPKGGDTGGQYGVSISDSDGALGKYRYLLFDCAATESEDDFGNTFYSEIDVVSGDKSGAAAAVSDEPFVTHSTDGTCEITVDTKHAPELKDWARTKLAPALDEWYTKIVALLPGDGFVPPKRIQIILRPSDGVAGTVDDKITANSRWLADELNGQAIGALVHEVVHVVQQYRNNGSPGWLTEGIADYIRWYKYEPQTHGTEIKTARAIQRAKYTDAYRTTANFLNFVSEKYDQDIVTKINAALRQGKYKDDLWKTYTGKTLPELSGEWKKYLYEKAGLPIPAPASPGAATNAPTGNGM